MVAPGIEFRQAREQKRHAGEVAVVLASLVGAAEEDLIDLFAQARMTAHELADRRRSEIVRAHGASAPP